MRTFKIPFDVKREEKIFGGFLSLRQVIYLVLVGLSVGILFLPIPYFIKIPIAMLFILLFLSCAFLRINEQNFDRFFFYALKYLFRKRSYIYERSGNS